MQSRRENVSTSMLSVYFDPNKPNRHNSTDSQYVCIGPATQDTATPRFPLTINGTILMNPAVVKELALSSEQVDRLRETFVRLQAERRKLDDDSDDKFHSFGDDFEA